MKSAPLVLALCLALFGAGCGGEGSAEGPTTTSAGSSTTSPASSTTSPEPPPRPPASSLPSQSGAQAAKRGEPQEVVLPEEAPDDLVVTDLIEGSGRKVRAGDRLTVEYFGVFITGKPFSNSWEREKPFTFELGASEIWVSPGWELGVPGMRVGGRRELIMPPKVLRASGVPSNARPEEETLVVVIDLLEATR